MKDRNAVNQAAQAGACLYVIKRMPLIFKKASQIGNGINTQTGIGTVRQAAI